MTFQPGRVLTNPGQVRFASKGVDYRGNKMALGVTGRQSAALFENVVCAIDECRWNVESKSFSGLEVDYKLEFGRLLDRQICGFGRPPRASQGSIRAVAQDAWR
jgi:hypothetical protein